MSVKAQDRFERLLLALPWVVDDRPIGLGELAAHVGTDVATLLSDLDALRGVEFDVAGHVPAVTLHIGPAGEDGRATIGGRSAHFRRPVRLTRAELAALDLGLGLLRLEAPPEEHGEIARVRDLLRRAAWGARADAPAPGTSSPVAPVSDASPSGAPSADGPPSPVVAGDGIAVEAAPPAVVSHFALLQRAQAMRLAARIVYARAGGDAPTERVVHPYALVRADGLVYVIAWCARAASLRVFRLDRIRDVTLDGASFEAPDGFSLEAVLTDGRLFLRESTDALLVVRYGPRIARWITEREGVAPDADGSVTVRYPLGDASWAVRHVLQYGPDAEVLSPDHVREAVLATLRAMG